MEKDQGSGAEGEHPVTVNRKIGEQADPQFDWGVEQTWCKEEAYALYGVFISGVPLTKGCMYSNSTEAIRFVVVTQRHMRAYFSSLALKIPGSYAYIADFANVLEYGYAFREHDHPSNPELLMWYTPNGSSGGKRTDTSILAPTDASLSSKFIDQISEAYQDQVYEFVSHERPNEFSIAAWFNYIVSNDDFNAADEESKKVHPKALVMETYDAWRDYNLEY